MQKIISAYHTFFLTPIDPKRAIIFTCVIFPVFIDAAYGFTTMLGKPIPFGVLYRGLIWCYGMLLLILDMYNRKDVHWLFIVFCIYPVFIVIWTLIDGDGFSISLELVNAFKVTYGFILLHIFYHFDVNPSTILKGLTIHGLIISLFFFFSIITGIGLETYGDYAFGISSFFSAGNEIGILLLIILGFHLFLNPLSLNKLYFAIASFLIISSLIAIGSTAGVFGTVAIISIYFFWKIKKAKTFYYIELLNKILVIITTILLLVISIAFIINFIRNNSYLKDKYETIITEGPRSDLRRGVTHVFNQFSFWENYVGQGASTFNHHFANEIADRLNRRDKNEVYRTVEMDLWDLPGRSYLLGGLILFVYGHFMGRTLVLTLRMKTLESRTYLLMFGLLLFHGMLAGHVLFAPTTLLALATVLYWSIHQEKILIEQNGRNI